MGNDIVVEHSFIVGNAAVVEQVYVGTRDML